MQTSSNPQDLTLSLGAGLIGIGGRSSGKNMGKEPASAGYFHTRILTPLQVIVSQIKFDQSLAAGWNHDIPVADKG
ncbi:MAG: hypothetical protein ACKVHO_05170, partial [Verrucomicrobiia bacterium]